MSAYVNNNGNFIPTDGYSIRAGNRAHLYGDGLFETIRVINGYPINLKQHISRLIDGMGVLKMQIPADFNETFFEREIQALLTKNELHKSARIRLSVDRKAGGHYLPLTNGVDYLIEADPILIDGFRINEKGLEVDLYEEIKKPINKISPYKTKNCLIYILPRIKAVEQGVDDLLIMNDKLGIIESTSSNLFIVSNGVLYTSGIELGCLGGTMRMQIINLALENNYKVYECNITPQSLLAADEVFLTNAVQGVLWVKKFRSKEYTNECGLEFVGFLNSKWTKNHEKEPSD